MFKHMAFALIGACGALCRCVLTGMVTALLLTASVASVHAAEFSAAVRAPEAPSNAELRKLIRDYFDTYARVNAQSAAGIVRDAAAHVQWFDTRWRLQRAIDTKKPLGDLSDFGIIPNGDGTYSTDLGKFPQWSPLDERLGRLLVPDVLEAYVAELRARGFREQDIELLKAYVEKNQPRRAAFAENAPLGESFAVRVKLQLARKQKVDRAQVMAFTYQGNRNRVEAERAWAEGLLDSLDKQRQRILESYLMELDGARTTAPDDIDAHVKLVVDLIATGEYVRLMEAERAEVQR